MEYKTPNEYGSSKNNAVLWLLLGYCDNRVCLYILGNTLHV